MTITITTRNGSRITGELHSARQPELIDLRTQDGGTVTVRRVDVATVSLR